MASSFSRSIRDRVHAYAIGALSLDDFKDWFIGATWDVEQDHPEAADLTYDIKLLLAEYSSGDLSKSDLRAGLKLLVTSRVPVAS